MCPFSNYKISVATIWALKTERENKKQPVANYGFDFLVLCLNTIGIKSKLRTDGEVDKNLDDEPKNWVKWAAHQHPCKFRQQLSFQK